MPLDFNIGSAAVPVSLEIDPSTDSDVVAALGADTPFPDRDLQLGRIATKLSTPTVTFNPGAGASVSMQEAASFQSGLAVYKSARQVLDALPLDPAITVDFQIDANDRLLLLSMGYTASVSVNGTSPIGVLGSATVGVSGQSDAAYGVVHRFDKGTGAKAVLKDTVDSLKLPSQITTANDLPPGTWLIIEIDGAIALNLAAKLGYSVSYQKQLSLLKVPHNLGAKIDAAVTATLGFTTSGKFLLILSRASGNAASQTVRLQLMKQRKNGWNIGLELAAGITATSTLPDTLDAFLSSVLGVHGTQVMNDLHGIESWINGDLGSNVAALTTKTAKDLLRKVTGVDPDTVLDKATGILKDVLAKWDKLGQNGSSEVQSLVWDVLGNPDKSVRDSAVTLLTGLASSGTFSQSLSDALQTLGARQWVLALSDAVGATSGLALSNYQSEVQAYANNILSVLNGDIFTNLRKEIDSQFNLSAIQTATDPAKLTQWMQDRLAAFLNETVLSSADLKQIQKALQGLGTKLSDIYDRTKSAINTRYSLDFATKYEQNTSDSALLDIEFDMAQKAAAQLFAMVVRGGSLDAIFSNAGPLAGVTIHEALLTHEIHSAATTHLAIPGFSSDSAHLNDTIAQFKVEQNGARLVGLIDSKDQVNTDRYASILQLADQLNFGPGGIQADPRGSISYEIREVRSAMSQIELENCTTDFVLNYLGDKFPSKASYEDDFLNGLDISISRAIPNHINNFGDMVISLQVALTADVLGGWLQNRDPANLVAAQATASRTAQQFLRKYTSLIYLQNLNNLVGASAAPLLIWSALPVVAGVDWDRVNSKIDALDTGKEAYWETDNPDLVTAMVNLRTTETNLEIAASKAYQRFRAAGDDHNASYFSAPYDGVGGKLRSTVLSTGPQGKIMTQFLSLLQSENQVISGVTTALKSAADASNSFSATDARQKILQQLTTFARNLTASMNAGMTNIYTKEHLMLFSPMLLVELSRVLAPEGIAPKRSAMLQLLSLKAGHTFDLKQFLAGSFPDMKEVAVGQTVVSSGA